MLPSLRRRPRMACGISLQWILIYSVLLVFLFGSDVTVGQMHFIWDVDSWGPCEHASCGPGGRQYRRVWCRMMTGQPVLDDNCQQDFRPAKDRACERSCTDSSAVIRHGSEALSGIALPPNPDPAHDDRPRFVPPKSADSDRVGYGQGYSGLRSKSDVEWVVDQWTSCQLVPDAQTCGRNSGVQHRNVTCERRDRRGTVTPARCELDEPQPATSQSCELLCRQDCVVSAFSDWSGCDSTCQLTNQTRTRQVIVPPRHRGSQCPELWQMSLCENCSLAFSYKLTDWMPCSPIVAAYVKDIQAHPLIGYQSRELSCLQSRGSMTSLSFCIKQFPQTFLPRSRACLMPQDCLVSPWSSLTPFNSSCLDFDGDVRHGYMVRTRQITQLALGDGQPCPPDLVEYIQLNNEDSSLLGPCLRGKWMTSSWSQCQPVPGYNHCGTGVKTRRAVCLQTDEDGVDRPVEDMLCPLPSPVLVQSCVLECPWDCSVSQWSVWTTCQAARCEGSDRRRRQANSQTGTKTRAREVLTLPGPGGRPCPHLSEIRPCRPQPCFTWNVTLGPCEPTTRGGCGDGTQLKIPNCLNQEGDKVRERFCHESLPTEQNWATCYLPCPEDCVLSEWGQWSSCPDPCSDQRGSRTRHRNILAYHNPGRRSRQCPSLLVQNETCPAQEDCLTYHWQVSPWTQCLVSSDTRNVQCGPGVQNRTVACQSSRGTRADDKCDQMTKPNTIQPCLIECPVDCHVTEWSVWSSCGVTCLPPHKTKDSSNYPTQTRRRSVLQYPQQGGLSCPSRLQEQQSCPGLPTCRSWHWETSSWSDCVLPPVVPLCGQGLRARNITCRQTDERGTNQVSDIICLEHLGVRPDVSEMCYVPCDSECQFSQWTQWTLCVPPCEKTRFRLRRLLDTSKNNARCYDTDVYPRDQHEDCVCHVVQPVLIGGWSDCIIQSNYREDVFASMSLTSLSMRYRRTNETDFVGLAPQLSCGKGKRYRVYSCQGPDMVTEGNPVCTGAGYREEDCSTPCPVDCKTSSWSPWSPCSSSCGVGLQQRVREVVTLPQHGGRRCPFLYGRKETQTKLCNQDCNRTVFRTEDWDSCFPSGGRECGQGTNRRMVRCVSLTAEGNEIMMVDESFCNQLTKPQTSRSCTLPCPGECVLSEWSDWTVCSQPCTGREAQTRVRHVLRMPFSHSDSQSCLPQKEERICQRWKNCLEFSWELSDWTSCLVNYGEAECGVGHKERAAFCQKDNGGRVDPYFCEQVLGPVTEPLSVSCEIPCDIDCLVSSWSEWSPCSKTCGLGMTYRSRTVLQNPIGHGRKCPERMDQSKPCFYDSCYRWYISEWSHCIIPVGACGVGFQERNVSCLDDEGKPEKWSKCEVSLEIAVTQTSRSCNVPCPGECKLTEWSSWSDCFISCEDFHQGFLLGVQARSRAVLAHPTPDNLPCNRTLWEDRTCKAESCTVFSWRTTDWDRLTYRREVFCTRNDSLRVEGGCDESQIPARVLTCTKPSCLSPALCLELNVCSCPEGEDYELHPVNSSTVTCLMNSSAALDRAAADVQMAKSPNIWMYAVIAIGTLFVIAVTAALYNMCELFRTGPRPRRKGPDLQVNSTVATEDGVGRTARPHVSRPPDSETGYGQLNHLGSDGEQVLEEALISTSSSSPSPCHGQRASWSRHQADIPLSDCTPTSSCLTNVTSSPATVSTPLTPTDGDLVVDSHLAAVPVSQVGDLRSLASHPPTSPFPCHLYKLPRKHNRRYRHIHRLLPARVINCLACNDSSKSMLGEPDEHGEPGTLDDGHRQSSMPAAEFSTLNVDVYKENGASCSSFEHHNCMLPAPRDLKLTNLDFLSHERPTGDRRLPTSLDFSSGSASSRSHKSASLILTKESPETREVTVSFPHTSHNSDVILNLVDTRNQGSSRIHEEASPPTLPLVSRSISSESRLSHTLSRVEPHFTVVPSSERSNSVEPLSATTKSLASKDQGLEIPKTTALTSTRANDVKTSKIHSQSITLNTISPGVTLNSTKETPAVSSPHSLLGDLPKAAYQISSASVTGAPVQPPSAPSSTGRIHSQEASKTIPLSLAPSKPGIKFVFSPSPGVTPSGLKSSFLQKHLSPLSSHSKESVGQKNLQIGKITSSASLPENLTHSTGPRRSIPSLGPKLSQDSGHSTIPRSQTTSLEEYSSDNTPEIAVKGGHKPRMLSARLNTSLEFGHSSSVRDLVHPGGQIPRTLTGSMSLDRSRSASKNSNICGMETSV